MWSSGGHLLGCIMQVLEEQLFGFLFSLDILTALAVVMIWDVEQYLFVFLLS